MHVHAPLNIADSPLVLKAWWAAPPDLDYKHPHPVKLILFIEDQESAEVWEDSFRCFPCAGNVAWANTELDYLDRVNCS
jgi:hypothetical protein